MESERLVPLFEQSRATRFLRHARAMMKRAQTAEPRADRQRRHPGMHDLGRRAEFLGELRYGWSVSTRSRIAQAPGAEHGRRRQGGYAQTSMNAPHWARLPKPSIERMTPAGDLSGLDVAVPEFHSDGAYKLASEQQALHAGRVTGFRRSRRRYPIVSIEDGMARTLGGGAG